jgi:hypothetical protein
MTTRAEHLAWCKSRAIGLLERGDPTGAVRVDDKRSREMDRAALRPDDFTLLSMDGLMFCKTPDQVRHWIEGFN